MASGAAALSDISDLYSPVIPRHLTSVPEEARRGQRRDIRLLFALTFKFRDAKTVQNCLAYHLRDINIQQN